MAEAVRIYASGFMRQYGTGTFSKLLPQSPSPRLTHKPCISGMFRDTTGVCSASRSLWTGCATPLWTQTGVGSARRPKRTFSNAPHNSTKLTTAKIDLSPMAVANDQMSG